VRLGHRSSRLGRALGSARPALLGFLLLLAGACYRLLLPNAPARGHAEIDLLAAFPFPNLISTSAEWQSHNQNVAELHRHQVAKPQGAIRTAGDSAASAASDEDLQSAGERATVPPCDLDPAIPYRQRGDSPMMRTWKLLGLPLVLAAVLVVSEAPATEGPLSDSEKLDQIQKEVEKVVESLKAMGSDLKTTIALAQKSKADIDELRKQLDDLKKEVDQLKSGSPGNTRVSASPPQMGKVLLINNYTQDVTAVVNQTVYRLRPGESREVDVPAGPFTYRIFQAQATLQNRVLAANETYTIAVH
jgi:hypothetical protein